MKCPHCGDMHPDQALFCPKTGKTLQVRHDACQQCGANLPAEVDFCPACGSAVSFRTHKAIPARIVEALKRPQMQLVAVICLVFMVGLSIIVSDGMRSRTYSHQSVNSENTPAPTSFEIPQGVEQPSQVSNYFSTATDTPAPLPSVTPATRIWLPCSDSYPSRLHVGDRAYVSYQPPLANRVRSNPNLGADIIGLIQPGESMKIINGPACANQWVWWYVQAHNEDLNGWTAEGDGENYWLVPSP